MQFAIQFPINKAEFEISHQDQIVLLGSCFSEEIAKKLNYNCFQIESNPFGVVFHPILLSQFIDQSILSLTSNRILKKDNIYLSWDANSTIYNSVSEVSFSNELQLIKQRFKTVLTDAKVLFVTFGTAWGYRLKETNELVANCHKIPSNDFTKELTEAEEIVLHWKETIKKIKEINPEIAIVFTVSPVRHIKDGIIENNHSKSILIDAVRKLTKNNSCYYFPSYEIVMDELRDYRFFKPDLIHPSEQAIDYVWSRFEETYFNQETISINKEIMQIKNMISHKSIHQESTENKKMQASIQKKLAFFKENYPSIILK